MDILITGGRVIDPGRFDGPGDLLIRDGRIAAVTAGAQSATVAVLREVLAPEGGAAMEEAIAQALAGSVAQDQLEYLGRALEAEAGVAINPAVLESVLSQLGA